MAVVLVRCGYARDGAVIDGFQKTTIRFASFEPVATPAGYRHVRHVGIHLHSRHETATETELPRDRILMDLVVGSDRSIESAHFVRGDC